MKLRITHKGASVHINLGIKVASECWDKENNKVVEHKKEKTFNSYISSKMTMAESLITKLSLMGTLNKYSALQLKTAIENGGQISLEKDSMKFYDYFVLSISKKKKSKTILSYETSLKRMREFDPMLEDRTFEEIDLKYMQRFDEWFDGRGVSINARAVYYRNIRAVFNGAVDDKLTDNYPFRQFKIKKTPTKKRNISVEELRMLRDYPVDDRFLEKYRDMFMMMFYLRGINAVDLFRMKESDIRLGRLNYIRSKTGKYYSVKIEPEARVLIEKYKGKEYLIDVCDGAKDHKDWETKYEGFLQRMTRGLKRIGPYIIKGNRGKKEIKPILPFISQYWCRHTSATLMMEIGYSNEIIASSLGHEYGNKTTNIYIEYNEAEVDKANRALIDYVNGNDMDIQLDEKVAEKAKELAKSMGMTANEVVEKIIEWYIQDCEKEK